MPGIQPCFLGYTGGYRALENLSDAKEARATKLHGLGRFLDIQDSAHSVPHHMSYMGSAAAILHAAYTTQHIIIDLTRPDVWILHDVIYISHA